MLKIEGKTFMNIQEAVQWLLDNNALPFQSTANYVGNTEIGLGTIVNPSPAKVRIGSLIFFADSKVSTVVGITETGFICSDQYNNLVDDIAYVTNVAINASGHLITTLSDGQTIDAGIIKQVSSFSINASQHLIVTYNDGVTADLGAIFNGNVNIAGNFTANSIIENMTGYSFIIGSTTGYTYEFLYAGVVKTGNKITFSIAYKITKNDADAPVNYSAGYFNIPNAIGAVLVPTTLGGHDYLSVERTNAFANALYSFVGFTAFVGKNSNTQLHFGNSAPDFVVNTTYYIRNEVTFLLSENLAS